MLLSRKYHSFSFAFAICGASFEKISAKTSKPFIGRAKNSNLQTFQTNLMANPWKRQTDECYGEPMYDVLKCIDENDKLMNVMVNPMDGVLKCIDENDKMTNWWMLWRTHGWCIEVYWWKWQTDECYGEPMENFKFILWRKKCIKGGPGALKFFYFTKSPHGVLKFFYFTKSHPWSDKVIFQQFLHQFSKIFIYLIFPKIYLK